jgi:hypothetical protein
MSGGAVAAVVFGVALGVGISSLLALDVRRRRADRAAEHDASLPTGLTGAPAQAVPYVQEDAVAAEFERGYHALLAYLRHEARPDGSSQSAD